MGLPVVHSDRLVYLGRLVALGLAYIALGRLGLAMSPVSGFATLVWPPTGLALAALVLGGYRLWPALAVGAFVANLWAGAPLLVAAGMSVGNTLEAVVATYALRKIPRFRGSLDRFVEVAGLVVLAGLLSTVVSATVGTTSLLLGGLVSTAGFAHTWITWWTGNLISDLIVAPVLLTLGTGPRRALRPRALAEAALLVAVLAASAAIVFGEGPEVLRQLPILRPYVLIIPLMWGALRFGPAGAALGMLVVAAAAVLGTYTGYGVFASTDVRKSLVALHVFLGAAAVASLTLGAVVSEREHSRQSVRESELDLSRLAAIVESSADAIIGKALDGRITSWNAAAERMYGYSRAEVIGQPIWTVIPEDRRDELAALMARVRRGERIVDHVTVRRRKDGASLIVALTLSPILDSTGAVSGISAIARDITERRRIEDDLRESEERLRLALLAADLGTWCWEPLQDRLVWSPLCKRMHGLEPDDEVCYARFLATIHPEDRERTVLAVERALARHEDYRMEHRAVWPDGSVRWLSVFGRASYDDAGRPARMLGVTMDVTSQKQAEQEQKQAEQDRAELLESERAARAEAERAARLKDEFVSMLSHELRTPLNAILGWATMLGKGALDKGAIARAAEVIERNARAQARLIEDLLDLASIGSGKLRLNVEPVALAELVKNALASVRLSAEAKGVRLEATLDELDGQVHGDAQRLQQVVQNLLTNAIKFTPRGGSVEVALRPGASSAEIVVADTGIGIRADFLPHVFDRFRQADASTKRRQGGLGLGLAIVKHIVELHGGAVSAESEGEGRGATFTVSLPVAEARQVEPPKAVGAEGMKLRGLKVLVVDDEQDAREILTRLLQEYDVEVISVGSAEEALREIERARPDVLLCDIGLPERDGYQLIRDVRQLDPDRGGRTPAAAVTAFARPEDRLHALRAGYQEHIAKPIEPAALVSTVASLATRTTSDAGAVHLQ